MKTILYINNERCNTFEMLENHFLSVKSFDDVFYDLVDFGRYQELSSFLREVGEFEKADKIRDELFNKGIKLIDSREGTTYEII